MKSDFFCNSCCKYHSMSNYAGELGGKKHCMACYPAAKKRVTKARAEALMSHANELTKEQKLKIERHKVKVHKRSAQMAFEREIRAINAEMMGYQRISPVFWYVTVKPLSSIASPANPGGDNVTV